MSLGSLYERGLGVSQNNVTALALYRDASGLTNQQVEFVTPAQRQARVAQNQQLTQTKRDLQIAQKRIGQLGQDVSELQTEAKRLVNLPPKVVTKTIYKTRTVNIKDPQQDQVIQNLAFEINKLRRESKQTKIKIVRVPQAISTDNNAQTSALLAKNAQLKKELARKEIDIKRAEKKMAPLQAKASNPASIVSPKKQLEKIKIKIATKKKELKKEEKKVARLRSANKGTSSNSNLSGVNFGNYYALVIGNDNYTNFSNLKTPVSDAKSVASVLRSQYGFKTSVLKNASKRKMLSAFNTFVKRLSTQDNLLIYYAGHGQLSGGGHWLPSDAETSNRKSWIPNTQLTNFIDAMKAKHILVVADSCYSGTLSQSSIPRPLLNSKRNRAWFDAVSTTKVRVVMSSGGIKPVLDSGSGNHSVFANKRIFGYSLKECSKKNCFHT
jgi:predicted  nucleic acid-binding Zn-ribbon protein